MCALPTVREATAQRAYIESCRKRTPPLWRSQFSRAARKVRAHVRDISAIPFWWWFPRTSPGEARASEQAGWRGVTGAVYKCGAQRCEPPSGELISQKLCWISWPACATKPPSLLYSPPDTRIYFCFKRLAARTHLLAAKIIAIWWLPRCVWNAILLQAAKITAPRWRLCLIDLCSHKMRRLL
jgi:hypothetical protein